MRTLCMSYGIQRVLIYEYSVLYFPVSGFHSFRFSQFQVFSSKADKSSAFLIDQITIVPEIFLTLLKVDGSSGRTLVVQSLLYKRQIALRGPQEIGGIS